MPFLSAWNGSDDSMVEFVSRHGLTFTNVRDGDGSLFARFGVPYQPAFALVAADGSVQVEQGAIGQDDLVARLEQLVTA